MARLPWHVRLRAWVARTISPWAVYDGATTGARGAGMLSPRGPVDDLSLRSVAELRARARHMARNRPAARRAAAVVTTHVVGTGIMPSSSSEEFDAYLAMVRDPQRQIGTVQGQTLASIQRLAFRTTFIEGAALVVRQRRTPKQMQERDLVTPWQLEVLSPDQLCTDLDDGIRIRGGIETDETGWIVAYHLYRQHPDAVYAWNRDVVRVPAEDVAYVWADEEPGQLVGVTWLQAVMLRIEDWDQLSGAQVVRHKVAAMFAAFVHQAFGGSTEPPSDRPTIDMVPGRVQYLLPGEEVTFGEPPGADGYLDVSTAAGREVAAGAGLTYEDLTGDYSQVNYSSARMGALVSRSQIEQTQNDIMISRLCAPIGRWLIEAAEQLGIEVPDEEFGDGAPALRWTPPARELLDPGKEVSAIGEAIALGLTSRSEEIRKQGRDPVEVDRQRAADAKREKQMGLTSSTTKPDAAPADEVAEVEH